MFSDIELRSVQLCVELHILWLDMLELPLALCASHHHLLNDNRNNAIHNLHNFYHRYSYQLHCQPVD